MLTLLGGILIQEMSGETNIRPVIRPVHCCHRQGVYFISLLSRLARKFVAMFDRRGLHVCHGNNPIADFPFFKNLERKEFELTFTVAALHHWHQFVGRNSLDFILNFSRRCVWLRFTPLPRLKDRAFNVPNDKPYALLDLNLMAELSMPYNTVWKNIGWNGINFTDMMTHSVYPWAVRFGKNVCPVFRGRGRAGGDDNFVVRESCRMLRRWFTIRILRTFQRLECT